MLLINTSASRNLFAWQLFVRGCSYSTCLLCVCAACSSKQQNHHFTRGRGESEGGELLSAGVQEGKPVTMHLRTCDLKMTSSTAGTPTGPVWDLTYKLERKQLKLALKNHCFYQNMKGSFPDFLGFVVTFNI